MFADVVSVMWSSSFKNRASKYPFSKAYLLATIFLKKFVDFIFKIGSEEWTLNGDTISFTFSVFGGV